MESVGLGEETSGAHIANTELTGLGMVGWEEDSEESVLYKMHGP